MINEFRPVCRVTCPPSIVLESVKLVIGLPFWVALTMLILSTLARLSWIKYVEDCTLVLIAFGIFNVTVGALQRVTT